MAASQVIFIHRDRPEHGTAAPDMSLPNVFPCPRQRFDPHRFRAVFPDRWAGFLRAHHRNPEEVAYCYDVTFRTAMNWWDGVVRPTGDKVALAAICFPADFQACFGEAA